MTFSYILLYGSLAILFLNLISHQSTHNKKAQRVALQSIITNAVGVAFLGTGMWMMYPDLTANATVISVGLYAFGAATLILGNLICWFNWEDNTG